jgi:YYY domain-containing protein
VVKDIAPDNSIQEVITETPAFSFILGDNHPHTLALPFVLLVLSVATYFVIAPANKVPIRNSSAQIIQLLIGAIVIGGLSFLNTWDFPVYGALVLGGLMLGHKLRGESLLTGALYGLVMLVIGYLLYLPFYATFSSQARGIGVNLFNSTRFVQFTLMFAPFLIILVGFVANVISQNKVPMQIAFGRTLGFAATVVGIALLSAIVLGLLSPQNRALAAEMQSTGSVMGVSREVVTQRLIGRALSPGTVVFLSVAVASCASLFFAQIKPVPQSDDNTQPMNPSVIIVLALFAIGAALTLAPEFIFLQDLFGTRMNTVFKFYYQAWTLWSVAGAFAVIHLINTNKLWARIVAGLTLLLVAVGMLYPLLASFSKTNNFSALPTLDGAAYLHTYNPDDARAIDWLNKNVIGDPVVVERPDKGSYGYEGRISAFTGLPTPLGWGGHQNQWRGNYDEPGIREPIIASIYNTTDVAEARNLLEQLNVTYVVIGGSERAVYTPEGLAKFANFCGTAFRSNEADDTVSNTTIYKCR